MRTTCQSAKPILCHFRVTSPGHFRVTSGICSGAGDLGPLRDSIAPRAIHFQGEVIDRVLGYTLPVCGLCGCLPQPHPAGG
jgi:hypothetical protein